MKHIILFLAFFGVLLANAQEMDTTFVVNEQGQTVGIIHEKGTVPVIPQQQATAPVAQQQPAVMLEADSTAYYESMIDKYTQSGNSTRRAGKGMMLGGGIGAAVGLLMIVGACSDDDEDSNNNCNSTLASTGLLLMFSGATVFGIGTIVKIVGSSKIRRARRYEDRFQKYRMRQQYSMKLRFDPLIDPINKQVGGNLALDF
jgi:hypothetical protein